MFLYTGDWDVDYIVESVEDGSRETWGISGIIINHQQRQQIQRNPRTTHRICILEQQKHYFYVNVNPVDIVSSS